MSAFKNVRNYWRGFPPAGINMHKHDCPPYCWLNLQGHDGHDSCLLASRQPVLISVSFVSSWKEIAATPSQAMRWGAVLDVCWGSIAWRGPWAHANLQKGACSQCALQHPTALGPWMPQCPSSDQLRIHCMGQHLPGLPLMLRKAMWCCQVMLPLKTFGELGVAPQPVLATLATFPRSPKSQKMPASASSVRRAGGSAWHKEPFDLDQSPLREATSMMHQHGCWGWAHRTCLGPHFHT